MNEQKFCVVATDRNTGKRIMVTGALSENEAYTESNRLQKNIFYKKAYKYFKVAKYPYKK